MTNHTNFGTSMIWDQISDIVRNRQPKGQLPSPNHDGWIGPIHSPLREDRHPSFSVLPDTPSDPGAFKDHATSEGGSMADLARHLGVSIDNPQKPISFQTTRKMPEKETFETFCDERKFDVDYLRETWSVRETVHLGRPALQYPTQIGVKRIKYLDGNKPKYTWEQKGGRGHWYGLSHALNLQGPLYLVNGEPSVWAAHQAGVAAICLCAGEGTAPSQELTEELKAAGIMEIRVVYDRDEEGRLGAQKAVNAFQKADVKAVSLFLPDEVGPGGDVDDLHRLHGNRLPEVLSNLPRFEEKPAESLSTEQAVDPLSVLDGLTEQSTYKDVRVALYELGGLTNSLSKLDLLIIREEAIKRLSSLKFKTPARLVDAALKENEIQPESSQGQGASLTLDDPEPWPEEVDGGEL